MADQSPMDAGAFVTDAFLQSTLHAAAEARQQCLHMLDFIDQNRAAQPDQDAEMNLSRQQKLLHANLAKLRGLNRRAVLDTRNFKQQTQEAKSEIDSLHLHLQNLYYEQRHLIGDIAACQGYNHKYQTLPLISVDEILAANPELAGADEHDLMVARINHEHAERQTLEEQRQGLLKKKQSLIADNNKKKDELAALDKEIEKFIGSAASVQQKFDQHDQQNQKAAASA
ncbi:unnamed protein product [Aureobasidium mustum]|uniref:Fms interacting protein n=1 Tax=Aureobasidium mustum TaxID=2773714 RepID=A0A9N8K0X7_9PEZI|nr:unnamed protein product [Aureobasidium mustum]